MKKLWKFGCLSAFIISIFCLLFNDDNSYVFIFLLPFFYSILGFIYFVSIHKIKTYNLDFVYTIAQVLIYIRYVLTPFFTVFSSYFTSWGWGPDPSRKDITIAIFLMCIEECLIFITYYYTIRWFSVKTKKIISKQSHELSKEKYWLILIYAVFALAIVLMFRPALLIRDSYFMYTNVTTNASSDEGALSGMYTILAKTFKIVFLLVGLIICKRGYDKKNNSIFLVFAILAVVLNMALNTSGTRILMLFSLILGIYFLHYIFGKIPQIFYIAGGAVFLVSFISVSLVKFGWRIDDSSNAVKQLITVMMGQFQDYFAGPRLVAQMLNVHRQYADLINITTFFNDFLGSVPYLSNYIDQTNRINYYFNIYCGTLNQSLIAPILGIGYCYFPIFPFFLTIMFECFVIKLDFLMRTTVSVKFKYLYAYMGIICAMCMGYSTQNIYAEFVSTYIPLLVLFKVNDKLCLIKRKPNN